MSMNRKNKMGKRGHRRTFPMTSKSVNCAQCGKSTTKKKTQAVQVTTMKLYSLTKEKSTKNKDHKEKPREATLGVTAVRRVCAGACK